MELPSGDYAKIEKRLLERLNVETQVSLPFLVDGEIYSRLDDAFDRMICGLRGHVWMEVIQDETVTAKFATSNPATWWQHFKQRWFAAWMLKRWPVVLTWVREEQKHQFRTVAKFPEFKYKAPPNVGTYVLQTMVDRRF